MSTYRLEKLLAPRSVALVGASPRDSSVGRKILHNLRAANFEGPISLVNPRYREIDGLATVPSFDQLPEAPELAVIAVPPAAVPGLIAEAGEIGRASCRERV